MLTNSSFMLFSAAHTVICALLNKGKGKGKKYSSSHTASPLRKLTCHMGSHSVTCHPAEVTFPPLPQPIKASARFSDPGGMQG